MSTNADHLIDRHDAVDSRSSSEPTAPPPPSAQRSKRPTHSSAARGLILETILVTIGTVAVVSVLHARGASGPQWILIPSVLVAAALVPAWIGKREFPRVGLHRDHAWAILKTVGSVSACILPAVFLGLWVLTSFLKVPLPLPPILPAEQSWFTWLIYQFFYVAVAEEVFFRGYIQANTMRLLEHCGWTRNCGFRIANCGLKEATGANPQSTIGNPQSIVAILVSAACFAASHVVVQGQIVSVLTFLPGLVLAWLFIRTRSLLAPILFHGLANISYGFMALMLT